MISKHVTCKAQNDNYARLANYIADASHEGEKCLTAWCAGCWAGDDYDLAIQEVKDTQALNTRTTKEKTYHLVISFRPEDEAKLTPEIYKKIEEEFARALDFEEHQRHCGVHQNTANIHMHIAYNMIHPEKLTRYEPFRDYWKRDKLCRDLELKYGLTIDNGRNKEQEKASPKLNPIAATIKAQTGQASFDGYAKRHKAQLMPLIEQAQNWQELHKTLAVYGMTIKPQGNGLALVSLNEKHGIKASSFDRGLSKTKLEKQLGKFEAPSKEVKQIKPLHEYEKHPMQKGANRGELYKEYQAGINERIRQLDLIKKAENLDKKPVLEKWDAERRRIAKLPLPRREKFRLIALSKVNQKIDLKKSLATLEKQREQLKQQIPYTSWNQFLKWQAQEKGNETALAILRSQKVTIEPEVKKQPPSIKLDQEKWLQKEKEIIQNRKLLNPEKTTLLAIIKMRQLAEREIAKGNKDFEEMKHHIDNKGTVIFTLGNGGSIKDSGKQVWFSSDEKCKQLARLYSTQRWGKKLELQGNVIIPAKPIHQQSPKSIELGHVIL